MKYYVGQTFQYKSAPWLTPTLREHLGDDQWVVFWCDNKNPSMTPWTNVWPEKGIDDMFTPINTIKQLPEDLFSL